MTKAYLPIAFQGLLMPKRYKCYYGGRGGAKSCTFATALVLKAASAKTKILCAREIQKSIKDSVKAIIDDSIQRLGLGSFFKSTLNEIVGINGSQFIFAGLRHNPETIKSTEGVDVAWVEEANTVSQDSLDILIPTIRKENSELWFSYNPYLDSDPVHKMFVIDGRPDAVTKKVGWQDNPWFPDVLKGEMQYLKGHDYDKYLHVWEGETIKHSDALVFKDKYRVESFDLPKDTTFYYGADWGFSNDPTTLVRCAVDEDKREIYIDHEAYGVGVEIDDTPALFDYVPGSRDWKITADSARPETISYMNRNGFRVRSAKKGKGSILEGIKFIQAYTVVIHPRCQHTIDEFSTFSYKVDKHTGEILPILEDAHNHIIDGTRYALEQRRKPKVMI